VKGTLHLGDFHPELEAAFTERLRALCPGGDARRVRVVVPNRLLGIHLRRRAAELGVGTVGLAPRALEDLASELAAPTLAAGGWRPLPSWALPIVLEELLGRRAKRGYFKDIADLPGLYTALAGTLRDLRDGGVSAAAFAAAVERLEPGDWKRSAAADREWSRSAAADRSVKLRDLVDFARLAEDGLAARRLADMARTTELAIEALATAPVAPTAAETGGEPGGSSTPLLIYGIYDLLPRQRRLLAALAENGPVDVFFPWGAGRAFEYAAPLRAWFEEQGLVARPLAPAEPDSRLAALRRGLFAPVTAAVRPPDGSVRLLSAPHAEREALAVLRALAVDPAPSALVLLRREGDAVSRLRGASRRADLALHVTAESLADRPAGRAARLLLELVDQGAKRSGAASLGEPTRITRSPLLPRTAIEDLLSTEALERGLFDEGSRPGRWAQILRRRGIVARRSDWETLVERYAGSGPQAVLPFVETPEEDRFLDPRLRRERPALARWVQRLLAEIDHLAPALRGGPGAWSRAAQAIAEMLERWLAPGADRDAVQAAAASLAELDGAARVTPRRALTALEQALAAGAHVDGPRFGAAATVTTLAAARGVTAERVVVPGLVEGAFPRRAREDALLLDARARRAPGPPARGNLGAAEESRQLFRGAPALPPGGRRGAPRAGARLAAGARRRARGRAVGVRARRRARPARPRPRLPRAVRRGDGARARDRAARADVPRRGGRRSRGVGARLAAHRRGAFGHATAGGPRRIARHLAQIPTGARERPQAAVRWRSASTTVWSGASRRGVPASLGPRAVRRAPFGVAPAELRPLRLSLLPRERARRAERAGARALPRSRRGRPRYAVPRGVARGLPSARRRAPAAARRRLVAARAGRARRGARRRGSVRGRRRPSRCAARAGIGCARTSEAFSPRRRREEGGWRPRVFEAEIGGGQRWRRGSATDN
jgi:hypothetical protein